ncbi:hypothetical protein BDA99DRAFT_540355 [Phascolomyces articulosus]|uniref:Uncharacterized protein n=1 Tax=Phascolomyces articulosus TaxID=60185 RepID=A0AAD5JUA3_9FUNG|nr:hypothetical protein BDA99DRAFT_540355 [Phascolomyces articulosus]
MQDNLFCSMGICVQCYVLVAPIAPIALNAMNTLVALNALNALVALNAMDALVAPIAPIALVALITRTTSSSLLLLLHKILYHIQRYVWISKSFVKLDNNCYWFFRGLNIATVNNHSQCYF